MEYEDARAKLKRRAIQLEVGGIKPPTSPLSSWFGRVNIAAPGEHWPETDGAPMHALCQINLSEVLFRPPGLEDVAMLTVFVGPEELPTNDANGENWCLRAYSELAGLVPIEPRSTNSGIKPLPLTAHTIEDDYPCWEDAAAYLDGSAFEENYSDLFKNIEGVKLGGWPTLIQSEIFWAPYNRHPAAPKYVFQIDSSEKANWAWGDWGVGYFGRGSAPGLENEWVCEWQCF